MKQQNIVEAPRGQYCINAWEPTAKWPGCQYSGGHSCDLPNNHKGPCRCPCGSTTTRKLPVTDEQFWLLMELRAIPQRNSHWMILHGDKTETARELVSMGLVVSQPATTCEAEGLDTKLDVDEHFRLNKPGRERLLAEWLKRGRPSALDNPSHPNYKPAK